PRTEITPCPSTPKLSRRRPATAAQRQFEGFGRSTARASEENELPRPGFRPHLIPPDNAQRSTGVRCLCWTAPPPPVTVTGGGARAGPFPGDTPMRSRSRPAFTRIEFIVCLTMAGVVLALVLAAVAHFRYEARVTESKQKLKTITEALIDHADREKGRLP